MNTNKYSDMIDKLKKEKKLDLTEQEYIELRLYVSKSRNFHDAVNLFYYEDKINIIHR